MAAKKQYSAPVLETFGTVKELTFAADKAFGVVDGITLCQTGPLGNNPSNVVVGNG